MVSFINSSFENEKYMLCFRAVDRNVHKARYIAEQIKQTVDELDVTYKVSHIIPDSASNNIKFEEDFYNMVNYKIKNGFKDNLSKLFFFRGTSSLVKFSPHIIRNSTLSVY